MNSLSEPNWYGARLKLARESAGLSQEELAEKVALTRLTISRYESGEIKPGFERLKPLADAVLRPLSWFFEEPFENSEVILERLDKIEEKLQFLIDRLSDGD